MCAFRLFGGEYERERRSQHGRKKQPERHTIQFNDVWALVGAIVTCCCFVAIISQVGTADVLGTVTDRTGAVIAKAQVTIRNANTGETAPPPQTIAATTSSTPFPTEPMLLRWVQKDSATSTCLTSVCNTDDRARYNITLTPGAVSESVQVSAAAAPTLQTDSSTVSSTVEEAAVQDLPFPGRDFVAAIQIQPGANAGYPGGVNRNGNATSDVRPTFAVSANGQEEQLNNFLIDGFDDNERSSGLIGLQPSIDGIAEMSTTTGDYQAEYGRTAGAVVNVVTKSGTNEFHGSAYDYLRNDMFDGKNYFATGSMPEYRQNNFGGSLGGPIKRDKTFFFFDLEESREIKGVTIQTFVPTQYEEANPGDLSDLCPAADLGVGCPAGPILAYLNSVMQGYFGLFPKSQVDLDGLGYYLANPKRVQNSQTLDARLDHHFSQNDLFFARYARNPSNTFMPSAWPEVNGIYPVGYPGSAGYGSDGTTNIGTQNVQLDYVHIFSRTLILDLKAAYTRIDINYLPVNYGHGVMTKLGMPNAYIPGIPATDELVLVGGPTFEWSGEGDGNPTSTTNNAFQYSGS